MNAETDRRIDVTLTVVLMIVQVIVAFIASVFVLLNIMDLSCTENCDYRPTVVAVYIMAGVALLVTVADAVAVRLTRLRQMRSTWVPATAIAVIVITFLLCVALQTVGA